MAFSAVHPTHRFQTWQVWPGSYDNPATVDRYQFAGDPAFAINKQTPIASMGSCFAREIKTVLLRMGFNYIQEEAQHSASVHASAAWERVYSTFSMRQIFEYTFDAWTPELRWWHCPQSGWTQDPYRRTVVYDSLERAVADFEHHRACSRRALTKADFLILTLGLTEVWQDRLDGSVISLPSGPYVKEGGDMSRYEFKVSRYSENLRNLERIHELMATHNPGCKILVTVSPNHLWATFRGDLDVVGASCNSKSTLRAVADEFCDGHDNVHYFPSYEIATITQSLRGQAVYADGPENFHVHPDTVGFIMEQFFQRYAVRPGED
ncbi:MAG: GSCFA domain-containing protein [Myxococcota bacterium]